MFADSSPRKPGANFPITLVGPAAQRALTASARWEVVAVFRHSFYCRSREGSLICLGSSSMGGGPLNVVCDLPGRVNWNVEALNQGMAAKFDGRTLRVDGRFAFDLETARIWRHVPLPVGWDIDGLALGIHRLCKETSKRGPASGLGSLIPSLVLPFSRRGRGGALDESLARIALPAVRSLHRWMIVGLSRGGRIVGAPPPHAARLVGLGPGLTPSGDDFLGGVMVTLHAFHRRDMADSLANWALALASERTSTISFAHLACAAEGLGADALHRILAALCLPKEGDLGDCLNAIDAIGHCSGWDSLAGVAAACQAHVETGNGRKVNAGREHSFARTVALPAFEKNAPHR